jgi:phenylpropionate dioxygenase-like ring-hydroxylating dioxygenase large terminal subunit
LEEIQFRGFICSAPQAREKVCSNRPMTPVRSALVSTAPLESSDDNPVQRLQNPVPSEGDGGVFSQSWFPVCLSDQLVAGQVRGEKFLDGKVVAYRGSDGVARIMSAYCPHVGADLSLGCVIDNRLRCAFHQWEYDPQGICVRTAIGDPPPPTARLFKFPTREHYGVVWAFNGSRPLWDLPAFDHASDAIRFRCYRFPELFQCDPWVFAANTPDMQHLKVVHKTQFAMSDPHDAVDWDDWGFRYKVIAAHQGGIPIEWTLGIRGTSLFWQEGPYGDFWLGGMVGFGLPRPGQHEVFAILALDARECATDARERVLEERFQIAEQLMHRTINEDKNILNTIHYRPGALTRGDRTLARYLQFLRDYPRAHPAGPFIN